MYCNISEKYGTFNRKHRVVQLKRYFTTSNFFEKICIRMSHWRHTMVDGAKFSISYQGLAFLSSISSWQLISAPSTIMCLQCDIRILLPHKRGHAKLLDKRLWPKVRFAPNYIFLCRLLSPISFFPRIHITTIIKNLISLEDLQVGSLSIHLSQLKLFSHKISYQLNKKIS